MKATFRRVPRGSLVLSPQAPPHDVDVECAALGELLWLRSRATQAISETLLALAPEDFYLRKHQLIYGLILDLHGAGKVPGLVEVTMATRGVATSLATLSRIGQ